MKKIYDVRPPQKRPLMAVKKAPASIGRFLDRFNIKLIGGLLLAVGLVGGLFLMTKSANALFILTPSRRSANIQEEVSARSDLMQPDTDNDLLRAKGVSKEKEVSGKFGTTGLSETASKATGEVTVVNDYRLRQVLVKDTRFLSSKGKLFYSTEWVSIPSGEEVTISVRAAEAGPDYNIKPTTFSIPGLLGSERYTSVYAESSERMAGGERGETSRVTEDDIKNAKSELMVKAKSELSDEMGGLIGEPYQFLNNAIKLEVIDGSASVEVGEETDEFGYFLTVRGEALAYHKDDARKITQRYLEQELKDNEEMDNETVSFSLVSKSFDVMKGEALVDLKGSVEVIHQIDTEGLKKDVAGKSLEKVEVDLSSSLLIKEAEIEVNPFWVGMIPEELERIEIQLVD